MRPVALLDAVLDALWYPLSRLRHFATPFRRCRTCGNHDKRWWKYIWCGTESCMPF